MAYQNIEKIYLFLFWTAQLSKLASVAQSVIRGPRFDPRQVWQHSFVEIDQEIFSTVILSLPLITEGQLSVSGKNVLLVNYLVDKVCPGKRGWINFDMAQMG